MTPFHASPLPLNSSRSRRNGRRRLGVFQPSPASSRRHMKHPLPSCHRCIQAYFELFQACAIQLVVGWRQFLPLGEKGCRGTASTIDEAWLRRTLSVRSLSPQNHTFSITTISQNPLQSLNQFEVRHQVCRGKYALSFSLITSFSAFFYDFSMSSRFHLAFTFKARSTGAVKPRSQTSRNGTTTPS